MSPANPQPAFQGGSPTQTLPGVYRRSYSIRSSSTVGKSRIRAEKYPAEVSAASSNGERYLRRLEWSTRFAQPASERNTHSRSLPSAFSPLARHTRRMSRLTSLVRFVTGSSCPRVTRRYTSLARLPSWQGFRLVILASLQAFPWRCIACRSASWPSSASSGEFALGATFEAPAKQNQRINWPYIF